MDPISAGIAAWLVTWMVKHWWEGGAAEYQQSLDRHAAAVGKAHPDWSQRRVRRAARRQTRDWWWNQAVRGFPDWREARAADGDAMRARWAEAQVATLKRRRDAWSRIRDAKAEWDRLHDEERAAGERDANPDATPKGAPDAAERKADEPEIVDAEIVEDGEPTPEPPRSNTPPADPADRPTEPAPGRPHGNADPDTSTARPASQAKPVTAPAPTTEPTQPATTQPAVTTAGAAPEPEGAAMPPRSPGHVVPRNGTTPTTRSAAAMANGGVGESWTHGQFENAATTIRNHLDDLPAILEKMLRDLTSVTAGRDQLTGVLRIHHDEVLFMTQLEQMLAESNKRARPVVRAVDAAGGPEQIPQMPYFSKV